MKILSWNILHGGGRRVVDIISTIEGHDPDIVCLQEFRHGKSKSILSAGLTNAGLLYMHMPETSKASTNTVAIFSKTPISVTDLYRDAKGTVRCIEARPQDSELRVIAVSFPHKKEQIPLFELLLDLDDSYRDAPVVIVGDFNCGIPFEDSETKTFYATHLFQQLLRQGWTDSWRSRHPKAREFTWYSTQKGNGFRYDHALTSESFDKTISSVFYDHAAREQGVSDHSVMVIDSIFSEADQATSEV